MNPEKRKHLVRATSLAIASTIYVIFISLLFVRDYQSISDIKFITISLIPIIVFLLYYIITNWILNFEYKEGRLSLVAKKIEPDDELNKVEFSALDKKIELPDSVTDRDYVSIWFNNPDEFDAESWIMHLKSVLIGPSGGHIYNYAIITSAKKFLFIVNIKMLKSQNNKTNESQIDSVLRIKNRTTPAFSSYRIKEIANALELLKAMRENSINIIPVVDENEKLVSVYSKDDIYERVLIELLSIAKTDQE